MIKFQRLLSEQSAKSAASFLKSISLICILFFVCGLVLSILGRQTFILHTGAKTYNHAIYAEESHEWTSRGLTVSTNDVVRVIADHDIDWIAQAGLSAMYAVSVLPLIVCFWFLSRVFHNISEGRIFIEQNAKYLLYYGLIQIITALLGPVIKVIIGNIANFFSTSQISISTGQSILSGIIPNIACIVAAYILHYGIQLQDEVDHTL